MDDEELLKFVLAKCQEYGITAYEIGQNTSISQMGAHKILTGDTKKPSRRSLLKIEDYIERRITGSHMVKEKPAELAKPKVTHNRVVPYYDVEISGSFISSFEDASEYIKFYVDYEPLNDCTAFLPYAGDSMLPKYKSGDTLGVKQIHNLNVILWGEAHLVITNEQANALKTVKTIHQHPDPEKIILRAINPDFKGDTILDKKDILSLFLVKGKVELNQI